MTTMRLQSYLTTMFPNVQMKRPLFYNAPAGIRFTLTNQKGVWEREYMKNVYARAYEIFETLHEKNDELLLVFKANAAQDDLLLKKKKETAIKKFIRSRLKKQEVQSVALLNNAEYIIACKTNDVKEKLLLQSIANRDLHIHPAIEEECYIVNLNKETIFHLYDERGLDIVSNNQSSLQLLQQKFHDWILDIDAACSKKVQ
ncbi:MULTISPECIES: DUF3885 domain-containing protein [Priestia]|jgi:hypothetical protein|uniref:DUF3885 domain-containing protein n=7 Tax=Priestia TaxID=2800373 RepID=D5DPC6_PRIM1|nr:MULTISPECIES: DUF3885 domain-containing protein [Priestia]AVX09904.1 DUF3885 domain-containing protein [Bacillus sp. Y-01]KOP76005.1 hypothetical protein AMS61_17270 [Bacillus sp. FJAT-21351]KQU22835.1 hypothetical protein ASG61_04575 [Bacillus sp. Leaf75]KRE05273.1 hypothetical protein ASE46_06485 [Bacillus sp. Root239]KRF57304.1 hypothetical protein ASG98_09850 [Bacillus sp. Soil531]MBK0293873.1 DUF3885 domain-containing protein [Bacillus sp. S34]MBU8851245.1 DUF3885 domain-containing p